VLLQLIVSAAPLAASVATGRLLATAQTSVDRVDRRRQSSFLLRDRQVVGRRFCFEGAEAVWLTAEAQIKVYVEEGE